MFMSAKENWYYLLHPKVVGDVGLLRKIKS